MRALTGGKPAGGVGPGRRTGAQVAAEVGYLLSDRAAWITRSALPIDGGLTARRGFTAG